MPEVEPEFAVLESAAELSKQPLLAFDTQGACIYASATCLALAGFDSDTFERLRTLPWLTDHEAAKLSDEIASVSEELSIALPCLDGDESKVYLEVEKKHSFRPWRMARLHIGRDFDELQVRLAQKEQYLESLLTHRELILWGTSLDGTITLSEGAGLKVFGFEPGQLIGVNVFEMYASERMITDRIRRTLKGFTQEYEYSLPGKDGPTSWETRLRPFYDSDGKIDGLVAISLDVSRRARLERELRRAKTMEAIGLLAGGIAHDFNNVLTAILSFATVASRSSGIQQVTYLKRISEAGERGADMVSQLLAFAKHDSSDAQTVELVPSISATLPMLRQLCGPQITIDLSLRGSVSPSVHIDPTKLEQVILNLATNARDAMPDGGNLNLAVSTKGEGHDLWAGLEVTDTGSGMNDEVVQSAFEPFYSTKSTGTGLGLATSRGIITRAGGTIELRSRPNQGAIVEVLLPLASTSESQSQLPARKAPPMSRGGTILVVDDNKAVLESTAMLLRSEGYEITTAMSGADALECFESDLEADLVITDMSMPGMKGDELAKELRRLGHTMPILCVSGLQEYPAIEDLPKVYSLSKPYRGDEPLLTIARILRESEQDTNFVKAAEGPQEGDPRD